MEVNHLLNFKIMGLKPCPKCGEQSYIKTPMGRVMRESLGSMIHVADEEYWKCLQCGHKSERVRVNTDAGDHFDLPLVSSLVHFFFSATDHILFWPHQVSCSDAPARL